MSDTNWTEILTAIGGGIGGLAGIAGMFDRPDAPNVGYQGDIPRYTAVQEQVPYNYQAEQGVRRPGSFGRRYFTDMIYAQKPESDGIPTLPQAQATTENQKAQLFAAGSAGGPSATGQNSAPNMNDAQYRDFISEFMNRFGNNYAQGGLASLNGPKGFYLGGPTDGMADNVPTTIEGREPAALSDGEFVMPADVVSHLGNGNSNAGAQVLYDMMEQIRKARTGNPEQGRQINPKAFMPTGV